MDRRLGPTPMSGNRKSSLLLILTVTSLHTSIRPYRRAQPLGQQVLERDCSTEEWDLLASSGYCSCSVTVAVPAASTSGWRWRREWSWWCRVPLRKSSKAVVVSWPHGPESIETWPAAGIRTNTL